MKRIVSLIMALVLSLSVAGCSKKDAQEQTPQVGDPETTETLSFTLDSAELTLACRYFTSEEFTRKDFDDYLTPIEYDQVTPLVAKDEETLIAFTFTVKNLTGEQQNFRGGDWYVIYNGKEYKLTQQSQQNITLSQAVVSRDNGPWEYNGPINIFLEPGVTYTFRTYGILPLRTESLTDPFEIHIPMPSDEEEPVEAVYTINPGAEDVQ